MCPSFFAGFSSNGAGLRASGQKMNASAFLCPVAGVGHRGKYHFVCRWRFSYSWLPVAFSTGFYCRGGKLTSFSPLARFRGILRAFLSAGVPVVYLAPVNPSSRTRTHTYTRICFFEKSYYK